MKLLLHILFFAGFLSPTLNAQRDCSGVNNEIHQLAIAKDYSEIVSRWASSSDCSAVNDTIFADWEQSLQYAIKHSNADDQLKNVDNLLALYKNYNKNFPSNDKGLSVKSALLLDSHHIGKPEEIYNLLDIAFISDPATFTDPKALHLYFDLYFNQYKAGAIKEADVFAKSQAVRLRLNQLAVSNPKSARSYQSASSGIKALMAPLLTCDKLVSYYEISLDLKKNDPRWLQNTTESLQSASCMTIPFFLKVAKVWHQTEPNAKSAEALGLAYLQNNNKEKGLEYYQSAANLETDSSRKGNIYYAMATAVGTNPPLALDYLKKAVDVNPSLGKAWLLIAHLYAGASDCGTTPFEKKAIYFLAANTARKAGENDPSIKAASVQQTKQYLEKAPTKAEIKSEKKSGKKVTFRCWINETVNIPES